MIPENFEITSRQLEVFYYLCHGLPSPAVAYFLDVNRYVVRDIVRVVRRKLSASNQNEACDMLVSSGYISVTPESVRELSRKLFTSKYKKDFPYCLLLEIPILGFSIKISKTF